MFVSYFGFVSPQKGLEDLFRIADPNLHRIVLVCDLRESDPYHREILRIIGTPPWKGKVTVTGFLPETEAGRILSASDAIVLPFCNGASTGNGSLHAAATQGTFTLTTSLERRGYDPESNVYYAPPGDIGDMSSALATHAGRRSPIGRDFSEDAWRTIAEAHIGFYSSMMRRSVAPG